MTTLLIWNICCILAFGLYIHFLYGKNKEVEEALERLKAINGTFLHQRDILRNERNTLRDQINTFMDAKQNNEIANLMAAPLIEQSQVAGKTIKSFFSDHGSNECYIQFDDGSFFIDDGEMTTHALWSLGLAEAKHIQLYEKRLEANG